MPAAKERKQYHRNAGASTRRSSYLHNCFPMFGVSFADSKTASRSNPSAFLRRRRGDLARSGLVSLAISTRDGAHRAADVDVDTIPQGGEGPGHRPNRVGNAAAVEPHDAV